MFFFMFDAKPTPGSPAGQTVQRALITVFVNASDMSEAEDLARQLLRECAWIPESLQYALEPPLQHVEHCHPSVLALYQKAFREGIAMEIGVTQKRGSEGRKGLQGKGSVQE